MDVKHIEALLEKFWNAETNESEELQLRDYMLSGKVHDSLTYALPFFKNVEDSQSHADIDTIIIKKLVNKYFEGETSIDEESIIKEYFNQANVSEELRQYKSLFNAFSRESKVEYSKTLRLPNESESFVAKHKNKGKVISMWLKVASAAMFVGVIGYFLVKSDLNTVETQSASLSGKAAKYIEPETPEEALQMTIQALAMVSRKYKKGEQNLLEGMKTMNETNIMRE